MRKKVPKLEPKNEKIEKFEKIKFFTEFVKNYNKIN